MRLYEWIGVIAGGLTGLAVIWRYLFYPLSKIGKRTSLFLNDWQGHPADEARGIAESKGVMERLSRIEKEVHYNGGSRTLVDAIKEIETANEEQTVGLAFMGNRLDEMAETTKDLDDKARELQQRANENKENILLNRANIDDNRMNIETYREHTEGLVKMLSEKTDKHTDDIARIVQELKPKSLSTYKAEIKLQEQNDDPTEGDSNGE